MNDLTNMVDEHKIRSVIRRLFKNSFDEILGEIFQNSQRACASRVEIITTPESVIIRDNGDGLKDGVESLYYALSLARTQYTNSTLEDQHPMGVGLHSLLAHDNITKVRIASANVAIEIDPARWWTDQDYYQSWSNRVETIPFLAGFELTLFMPAVSIEHIEKLLTTKNGHLTHMMATMFSPLAGYKDILEISLNGLVLDTNIPDYFQNRLTLVATEYEGCKLRIFHTVSNMYMASRNSIKSAVVWYGQLIVAPTQYGEFGFVLEVLKGSPVNPLSPSRSGIRSDEKYKKLQKFVLDQIFEWAEQNLDTLSAPMYQALHNLDETRANKLPVFIAKPVLSYEGYNEAGVAEPVVFRYDASPVLINSSISNAGEIPEDVDDWVDFETSMPNASLQSFVGVDDRPWYTFIRGDQSRVVINQLSWKPGEVLTKYENIIFTSRGEWSFDAANWKPVTKDVVFVAEESSSFCDSQGYIGTTSPLEAAKSELLWAFFLPYDDSDGDSIESQESYFDKEIDECIRNFMGNTLPTDFTISTVRWALPKGELPHTISVQYNQENKPEKIEVNNQYTFDLFGSH